MTTPESRILAAQRRYLKAREYASNRRRDFFAAILDELRDGFTQADAARTLGWPRQRITKVINEMKEES